MKLRIYRNSLRFRLTPADVAALNETGVVVETAGFGAGTEFSYSVRTRPNIRAMRASVEPHAISVEIPRSMIHDWRRNQAVGLEHSQPIGKGKTLHIAIEKDFECLEGKMQEPGEIFYPNPNKSCAAKESVAGE